MRNFLVILSLCTTPLSAITPISETGSVSSTNASYDGTALILTGHVVLDHGLGTMTAEEASLQRQEEAAKDFPFALIQLHKEVLLALKNSSELRCEHADLDFSTLKGLLRAKENERVAYRDTFKGKKSDELNSLQMLSRTLELNFSKQEQEEKKIDYEIESVLAKDDVEIAYTGDFVLYADHALYRKLPSQTASRELQGLITAFPKDAQDQCHLIHQGDLIDADSMDVDLLHSKISMLHPHGTLVSSLVPHGEKANMRFHCDHLSWDHLDQLLTLQGGVEIDDDVIGSLASQEAIELKHTIVEGKRILTSIHAKGPTSLLYRDREQNRQHKILCKGDIHLDRNQLLATLNSPETQGKVTPSQQLYYEEEEIAFYADHASLEYAEQAGSLQPVSLTLKGNIRLFSHDPQQPFRCGIADRLSYSLATRTLILSANPGKKVLFSDESQGVKISAREVHITRDPETKQQTVKGVGNVQFAFSVEENEMLKQLFPSS
jgi:hypothetical protein